MSLFNWNGVRFPGFTMQQLNLDWILTEIKRVLGFFPEDGNPGTVLMKTEEGTAWEELAAVDININGVPEDTELTDTDKLIFYDVSSSANRKITAPNLLNSMMSNGTPLMDGTASAGTSKKPARYDHRHPTDTSRQAALSGVQMNAVNSGAPANSFDSNGRLKIAAGGTDAATAAGARANLETIKYEQGISNISKNAVICTLSVPSNGSRTINFNSSGFCEGIIFATGALAAVRETVAFGSTLSGALTVSTEFTGADLAVSVNNRAMTFTNTASVAAYLIIINVEGNVESVE